MSINAALFLLGLTLGGEASGPPTESGSIAQTLGEVSQAASAEQSTPASTSYSNTGGMGDRQATIPSITVAPFGSGSNALLIDGAYNNGYFWNNFQSLNLTFDFGSAKVIDEAKWYQDGGGSHGDVKWQGSNDNSAWTDVGASFTLGGVATQTQTALNGNTTAYRYWRMVQVSGSTSNGPYLREIEFKISA